MAIYSALLYTAGAAPALLPALYLLFAAVAGPWRAWDFLRRKHAFFLIDFCYVRHALCLLPLVELRKKAQESLCQSTTRNFYECLLQEEARHCTANSSV